MKNYLLNVLLLLFAATIPHESTSQNIRIQLKWWHQFQFAGYYAAEIKGYYKAAGLSVTLIPGDKNKSPINEVINKNADYGVSGSEILIDYLNGAPIQVIAAIFQHSPYVIISPVKKHILSPKDLIGKKIMIPDAQAWVQLKAILIRQGIDPATILVIPHSWNNNDILNDRADAMSGYISVEVLQLEKAGEKLNLLKPADYGVDFYGDVLFALKSTIKSKVHITDKFRMATLKGWEYAMANPHEISQYILTLPGVRERGITASDLINEALKMNELVVPELVEIGHMNTLRWQQMLETYKTLNLVSKNKQLGDFIYDTESSTKQYLRVGSYIFIGVLIILFLLFIYSYILKKEVHNRTKEFESEVKQRKNNEESLKALSNELQNSNSELKQFAYIISHNLRAPVTNLLSLINLFNLNELTEKNALYFSKIGICTANINVMLKDLNEVLSVRAENIQDNTLINFESELAIIQESISEEISETGAQISIDFSAATEIIYSRKILHSIFQNLLTNAIKYRKPGTTPHINIKTEKVNNKIRLVFADNGRGINMQRDGNKVFGLYQRFNNDTEGKGLGLYIVKSQVEKYGGEIEVESVEDQGTKFIITFEDTGLLNDGKTTYHTVD